MKQNSTPKGKINTTDGQRSTKSRRTIKIIAILLGACVLFAMGWFSMGARISKTQSRGAAAPQTQTAARQAQPPEYNGLIGQWQRQDGVDVLEIRGVGSDGRLDAAYFNPNPVHLAHAETAPQGDTIQIFIELQDKGEPGAAYQLIYQRNQQILTGRYYQTAGGGSVDVYFVKTAR